MTNSTLTLNLNIEAGKTDRMPKNTMKAVFKALMDMKAKAGTYFIRGINGIDYCFDLRAEKLGARYTQYTLDVELTEEEGNTDHDVYTMYQVDKYNGKFDFAEAYYEAERV